MGEISGERATKAPDSTHEPFPPSASTIVHPEEVQEINARMLTTFDRLHKRGHLGSPDATNTPTEVSAPHHHPNTGDMGGWSLEGPQEVIISQFQNESPARTKNSIRTKTWSILSETHQTLIPQKTRKFLINIPNCINNYK